MNNERILSIYLTPSLKRCYTIDNSLEKKGSNMPRDTQSTLPLFIPYLLSIIICFIHVPIHADLSTLAKNDPYPVFKTIDTQDFLLTKEKIKYKDIDWVQQKRDRFNLSISFFGQNADRGKSIRGEINPPLPIPQPNAGNPTDDETPNPNGVVPTGPQTQNTSLLVPIGDITGRSSMIALLMGRFPDGQPNTTASYPGGENGFLAQAFNAFFPAGSANIPTPGTFNDSSYIDKQQLFGYFSFPIKYRKRGARIQFDARLYKDFGLSVQTGVSTIRQVVETQDDLTTKSSLEQIPSSISTKPPISKNAVQIFLMDELNGIAPQMLLNIGDFVKTSWEEIRLNLFWRRVFEFNHDMDIEWPHFLLIPFVQASGGFSPGHEQNPNNQWSLPFGNDRHGSIGFSTGLNFDFVETIEIGAEAGYTHFFKRNISNFRVPTSQFQTTLFPFATDVSLKPGANWYFGAKISAFHFVGNLSAYFEWFVLDHAKDSIDLKKSDPAFLPQVLEQRSSFKVKFGNLGLNYDVAPNIGLGFFWQMPFSQRNAFRSSTIMGGFNATF